MEEKARLELLKSIYEQHWLHARHQEAERHWFSTVFVAIIAGFLALLFRTDGGGISSQPDFFLLAGIFILVISIIGYSLCLTWRAPFTAHITSARKILQDMGLKDYDAQGPGYEKLKVAWGWFSAHNLYLFFYSFLAGLGLYLIIKGILPKSHNLWLWAWALIPISIGILVAYCFVRREKAYRDYRKSKRIVLEGCNGDWAQKQYLPLLIKKAVAGAVELWAVDIVDDIKLSPDMSPDWSTAHKAGRAHYLNKNKNKQKYQELSPADFVFVLSPNRFHSEIAWYWWRRLSVRGRIFIEKPLDDWLRLAAELKREVTKNQQSTVVLGFDHYLAKAHPFLEMARHYFTQIGGVTKIEFRVLESSQIPANRSETLDKGVIFDLFCHVLAVVGAVLSEGDLSCLIIKLKTINLEQIKGARYNGAPISGETFALITFKVDQIEVDCALGKGVGQVDEKFARFSGVNGKVELDFAKNSFTILDSSDKILSSGVLLVDPVATFLEVVLDEEKPQLSVPGVLSFEAAYEVLAKLDEAKRQIYKIGIIPEYQCADSLDKILEKL